MQNQNIRKVLMKKVGKAFAGKVATGWDTKAELLQIIGNDNVVYEKISEYGFDGMKILDVGCATGRLFAHVDSEFQNCLLMGVDLSEDMITLAQRRAYTQQNTINYSLGDFGDIEYGDIKFDIIIMKLVLHHMSFEEENIWKAKQLLSRKGKIIIYVPGEEHFGEIFSFMHGNDILGRKSLEELEKEINKYGLNNMIFSRNLFKMQFNSFEKFLEFLKRTGSYQKIAKYENDSWDSVFFDETKEKFHEDMQISGEFILGVYFNE